MENGFEHNDNEKKIDVEKYWNKKRFSFNWSKMFLTFIYVGFFVLICVYGIDYYVKTHDLTFIKFKINPEFGFVVNGKDKVVYYLSLNDDAKSIYNLDMFKGKSRTDALAKAIEVAKANNYLVEGEEKEITVTVVSNDQEKVESFEQKVVEDLKIVDQDIQSTVVEATEEEVEEFGSIEFESIGKFGSGPGNPPGQNGGTSVNGTGGNSNNGSTSCSTFSNSDARNKCSYTKLSSENMSGSDRYITSVNISKSLYPNRNDNVILVNSEDYVDGYLASSLSLALNAPVLTVSKTTMSSSVENEIKRLKASKVYVIGGTGVVATSAAEDKFKSMTAGKGNSEVEVIRIKGTDRFVTSVNVAKQIYSVKPFDSLFLIPSSDSMIDAGMVSNISGKLNIPMLYTQGDQLVKSVKDYITDLGTKIKKIYLISGLFTTNTTNEIKDLAAKYNIDVTQLKGTDRYKTNAAVIKEFNSTFNSVVMVNSQVDLITASAFAAKKNSALFYVGNEIDSEQINLINANNNISKLYYFGGSDAKTVFRYMVYAIKESNVSKCTNKNKELLYMNKHAVIYVPHQDDESSHLGQFITGAVERLGSENVHLVVITDGGGSAAQNNNAVQALLKEYNLTFSQARDREFRASAEALCVGDYKFVEELNLKNGNKNIIRMPDSGVKNNINNLKIVMKYYDNLYKNDGGVTHFTYTNFDSHTDHNTLGSTLTNLYFDTTLDNSSFSDVYLAVKYLEYYDNSVNNHRDKNYPVAIGVDKKIPSKYSMEYTNESSWSYMQNAFTKYQKNISDDGDKSNDLLGMGYASAEAVFVQFQRAMTVEKEDTKYPEDDFYPLRTPIHIPFKK